MAFLFYRRRVSFLFFLLCLLLLPGHPWVRPVRAADPWPLFTAALDGLEADEIYFGGWILFREKDHLKRTLDAWRAAEGVVVTLQSAPGPDGFSLLSFRCTDWRFCPVLAGRTGGELKGWTVEALLPGDPVDADRLAGLMAGRLQTRIGNIYRREGHVNLCGHSQLLPDGFQAMGMPVNVNLDLRYHGHRRRLRLQVGAPVLSSALTPAPTRF